MYSHWLLRVLSMVNDPKRSDMAYISAGGAPEDDRGGGVSVQGLPLIKPPWGRISAIDLNKGEIVWQIAHGETPDAVKNHPALKCRSRTPRDGPPSPARGRRLDACGKYRARLLAHENRHDRDARLHAGQQRQMQFERVLGRMDVARLSSVSSGDVSASASAIAACTGKGSGGVARLPRRSIAQPAKAA